jgi:hypothetical protein
MSDQFVTIAAFDSPVEAHIVRGLLEEEGIRTMLGGENATVLFAGVSLAEVTLQVHESDLEHAEAVLDEYEKDATEPGSDDDIPQESGWVCSLCGELVDEAATVCPSCQTPRDAVREEPAAGASLLRRRSGMVRKTRGPEHAVQRLGETTASVPEPSVEDEMDTGIDVPDVTTLIGDDMARRALLSAVFGLITMTSGLVWLALGVIASLPFFAYSAWMLLKLMTYSGEVSPAGTWRLYGAIAVDGIIVLFVLSILSRWWI